MLRGLAREVRHWGDFPEKLERRLRDLGENPRIDTLELPGAGRFSEMKSPLTVGEMTDFVRGKFLELRRRLRESGETPSDGTRLIGISLGGMIAADWASRWPDEFKDVILINTSFSGFSPPLDRLTPFAIKHMLGYLRPMTNLERELHAYKLSSHLSDANLAHVRASEWAKWADERPFKPENFGRQLLAAARYRAPLEKPKANVLVLISEKDQMVSPKCSRDIVKRWKVPSETHAWAGHDLTYDDADWVIEKTLAWMTKLKEIPERPTAGQMTT